MGKFIQSVFQLIIGYLPWFIVFMGILVEIWLWFVSASWVGMVLIGIVFAVVAGLMFYLMRDESKLSGRV